MELIKRFENGSYDFTMSRGIRSVGGDYYEVCRKDKITQQTMVLVTNADRILAEHTFVKYILIWLL